MWLPSWFSRPGTGRGPAARKRRGASLGLEVLENRLTPAVTLLVTGPGDAVAPDGVVTLREAVLAVNTNTTVNEAVHDGSGGTDSITFDTAGAFATSQTILLGGTELTITDSVMITGPGAANLAISGNHQSRIFGISGGATVDIAGLTITAGMTVGDGGGILNTGGTLTLDRVVLTDNHAVATTGNANGRGGAVANLSGATLTVTDCQFTGNQARGGGPGGPAGPLSVRCGAGIFNQGSVLAVSRSTFTGNLALGGPGGVRAQGGGINSILGSTATVTDCTFVGNQGIAGDGGSGAGLGRAGALFNDASVMTVVNCTIEGNVARGGSNITASGQIAVAAGGGGIFNSDRGVLVLSGCIVRGNLALGGSDNSGSGGDGDIGTALGAGLGNLGMVIVTDSVFQDNEARGGNSNRGSGGYFQFVGSATGGAIFNAARNTSGTPASLTLDNVTIRNN